MVDRRPLPFRLTGQPFDVREARALGVTRNRIDASDLTAPFYGVRMEAKQDSTHEDLCRALHTKMRKDQFFSHATAARIHRTWVPDRLRSDELHVGTLSPANAPRGRGIVGHQVTLARDAYLCVAGGLRAIDPVSAWFQLATELSVFELVIMGDDLVRRQHPATTPETLQRRVQRFHGRRGRQKILTAFSYVRPRSESPRETEVRLALVAAGLPEPEVNPEICDSQGQFLAYGDLVYGEFKVMVEYEGIHHRTDPGQYARDISRRNRLTAEGWIVIQISKHQWRNRDKVIGEIRAALLARGWDGVRAPLPPLA